MLSVTKGKKGTENLNFFNWPHVLIAGKRMDADKVIQRLFDKDFGLSENETSDEEGIPVARGGSRGSVQPPFRVTGSKYFSHTPHITSGIVICSIVLNLSLNYLLFFWPSLSPSDLINIQLLGYKISLSYRHE